MAIGASFLAAAPAYAQATAQADENPAEEAGLGESGNENEIVVTGSRIERAGFDQPTPTTVLGDTELRQGARPNLQQVLNDQPQVRATVTPTVTVGNTGSGTAPVDLRGLGTARTLTLLNGRRFVGDNNLNLVPVGLVDRVDLVTGGASAAYGSGAVAGVVNIILKDDLEGLSLGGSSGVSSRGDGWRYGFDGAFGTRFADGKGHFMIGAEYVNDKGIGTSGRLDRRNLRSPGVVTLNGQQMLVEDVNYGYQSAGGLISTYGTIAPGVTLPLSVLAGQTFNADGTLRSFRGGTIVPQANAASPVRNALFPSLMVGGEDGSNLYDDIFVAAPFERLNTYARVSYDIGGATLWADASYGRVESNYPFFPDIAVPILTISANNAFLRPEVRDQLLAAGQTSFNYGRIFTDILFMDFSSKRENKEGAIGIEGRFGNGWKYNAHFSHGEVETNQSLGNSRLAANFTKAIDAVLSNGQIVCAVNADADPTNNDAACRPLDIFGQGNASAEAIDYVTGTQSSHSVSKLDSAAVQVQGDVFSLWAGPVTVAVGAEARWEEQVGERDAETVAGGFGLPVYTNDLSGGFNVKEGFVEIAMPLLDVDKIKLDFNGAARYSDYSTSGGIWSWKLGGTLRLFNDLLLRATRSRDIRSPSISDLFSIQRINIGPLVDQDKEGRTGIPGYDPNPAQVTTYSGGNPDLVPEVARTLAIGGSYSPSFLRGVNLSVDYYDIDIRGAITNLSASNLTAACAAGNQAACDRIIRDPVTQTVTTAFSNSQNIAAFQTSGFDFEVSYVTSMSQIAGDRPGTLRFRALATHIKKFIFDTGVTRVDTAGDVGDAVTNGIPKWRGVLSATYQDSVIGLDARLRYVGGGQFNHLLTALTNNDIGSRTYLDIGAQFKVMDKFTFFGNVNNVFDVDPPLTTTGNAHYDSYGRYFTFGAKVNF